jgi:hypothetical protein
MQPVDGARPYPAEKARGGEIILRTPTRRVGLGAGGVGALAVGGFFAPFA